MSINAGMADLEDLYPLILPFATAAPEPIVNLQIINAAREFCQKTRCWREIDTDLPVLGDEIEIICVPPMAALFEIEEAWFDGRPLEKVQFSRTFGGSDDPPNGSPSYITQAQPNSIRLSPRGSGTLRISMTLQPALGADVIPAFMIDQWGEQLSHGALARLLAVPHQTYTDLTMAAYYKQAFMGATDENFAANLKGQQSAPLRTRASSF